MKEKREKQKQEQIQLTRNPFDKDPFRKKQQIATASGHEHRKTKDVIHKLERIQKSKRKTTKWIKGKSKLAN